MTDIFRGLNSRQLEFIGKECGATLNEINSADNSRKLSIYEAICDIEVEETIKAGDGTLSARGKAAESIVTIIGNNIRDLKALKP